MDMLHNERLHKRDHLSPPAQNSTLTPAIESTERFNVSLSHWLLHADDISKLHDMKIALTSATLALRALHLSPSEFRKDLLFWFNYAAAELDSCLNTQGDWRNSYVDRYDSASNLVIASNTLAWVTYSVARNSEEGCVTTCTIKADTSAT